MFSSYRFVFCTIALVGLAMPHMASAGTKTPSDFKKIRDEAGVALYQRHKDFVHIVDPKEGGSIDLLAGDVMTWNAHLSLKRNTMADWWNIAKANNAQSLSIVNGTFFDPTLADQAPLAYSIKVDGKIITGYADQTEYLGRKRMFVFNGTSYNVLAYKDDPDTLLKQPESMIIVGLQPDVSKSSKSRRGRTFLGTDNSGRAYIYSSPGTTQRYAVRMLQHFGANPNKIVMLDGGGSSYLLTKGKLLLPQAVKGSEPYARALPQVLVVQTGNAKVSQE
jgi:hypothetical protein